jgi:nucleoside-diphosphate-sugar epimerase
MKQSAIVTGCRGRLGRAFASRLLQEGFEVHGVDIGETQDRTSAPGERLYFFDLAYEHGDPDGHVERVSGHLENWRRYEAIFVPSSLWIGADSPYGRAKMAIEQLAARYRALGARVVTDRIGYFPGDGIEPDPNEPFYEHRVTGDALYTRVMGRMRPPTETQRAFPVELPHQRPSSSAQHVSA